MGYGINKFENFYKSCFIYYKFINKIYIFYSEVLVYVRELF